MKRGFSLVELSIVLVILGLLTGGILAGQSLIRASELRAVTTEYNRYVTATQSFRDKYFAIPGDMTNATKFWSAAGACPTTVGTSGTQTCDGDGNGKVTTTAAASQFVELFTYWQHLASAGLIEGSYTGIAGAGGGGNAVAGNIPRSKLSNGSWFMFNWDTTYSGSTTFDGTYRDNMLQFGSISGTGSNGNPVLKPEEEWNIDTKLDDGKPATGNVRERFWGGGCTDAANSTVLTANYALSTTGVVCVPFFYVK